MAPSPPAGTVLLLVLPGTAPSCHHGPQWVRESEELPARDLRAPVRSTPEKVQKQRVHKHREPTEARSTGHEVQKHRMLARTPLSRTLCLGSSGPRPCRHGAPSLPWPGHVSTGCSCQKSLLGGLRPAACCFLPAATCLLPAALPPAACSYAVIASSCWERAWESPVRQPENTRARARTHTPTRTRIHAHAHAHTHAHTPPPPKQRRAP